MNSLEYNEICDFNAAGATTKLFDSGVEALKDVFWQLVMFSDETLYAVKWAITNTIDEAFLVGEEPVWTNPLDVSAMAPAPSPSPSVEAVGPGGPGADPSSELLAVGRRWPYEHRPTESDTVFDDEASDGEESGDARDEEGAAREELDAMD